MSPDPRRAARPDRPPRARPAVLVHGPFTRAEWRSVLHRTAVGFARQRGVDAAAALTYHACLALFPIALSLLSALALVSGSAAAISTLLDVVGRVTEPATVAALRAPLAQLASIPAPGAALTIGLVLTVWAVSGYAACFGRVLNAFYGVPEGRRVWRSRAAMALLSLPLIAGGAVVVGVVLTTPEVAGTLGGRLGVPGPLLAAYQVAKWPIAALVLALMLGALYLWAPNVQRQIISPVSWGALVALLGCAVASAGFALYVSRIGHYDVVYGWLGGALVLLVWLFLLDLVLVAGASLDTEIVRMHQLRDGIPAEETIRVPMRDLTRVLALHRADAGAVAGSRAIRERYAAGVPGRGYRGRMNRSGSRGPQDEDLPTEQQVEADFTVPEDADLRPEHERPDDA